MAMADASSTEPDALASLEERILRAVQLVTELRSENEALRKQIEAETSDRESSAASLAQLRSDNERLSDELETLRAERKQVRTRIEKLLGQIDLLAT